MWTYKAHLDRLVDGDTMDVWVELRPQRISENDMLNHLYDFGFSIYGPVDFASSPIMHHQRLRLWGIDAPELRGEEREEGQEALRALAMFFSENADSELTVETVKEKGKYGRYIAKAKLGDVDISTWMVDNAHAEWRDY